MVTNALWVRLYQEQRKNGIDENLWARANGFDSAKDMGPEEYTCPECEGSGKIVREVSLEKAFARNGTSQLTRR